MLIVPAAAPLTDPVLDGFIVHNSINYQKMHEQTGCRLCESRPCPDHLAAEGQASAPGIPER